MVGTVTIEEANTGTDGNPGTHTRVDGQNLGNGVNVDIRFATMDAYNPVAQNPCVIPSSGDNYSYWKHLFLSLTGTFTTINNVKFYSDGTINWTCGTDGGLYVGVRDTGDNGAPMDTDYDVATGSLGITGHGIENAVNGHRYYNGQTTKVALVTDYTSGSPLVVDSTDHTVAEYSKAVVLQTKIHSDATQGSQSSETLTMVYDEI